mmetsp:Transcript_68693/g.108985  ORF Transcript_68693/g.108985 Transcript_68693/m.108985 type:complete len:169 (+) Transcript_68693:49-555(+)
MFTCSILLLLHFVSAARRKPASMLQRSDSVERSRNRQPSDEPVWGEYDGGADFVGFCSEVAQQQWTQLNFVVHSDERNGEAYLRCVDDALRIKYKVSCKQEHCRDDSGVLKVDQVANQQGWCFVNNGCGTYSKDGPCRPVRNAPENCKDAHGRSYVVENVTDRIQNNK